MNGESELKQEFFMNSLNSFHRWMITLAQMMANGVSKDSLMYVGIFTPFLPIRR